MQLLDNFAHYEAIFAKSMTPPPATANANAVETTPNNNFYFSNSTIGAADDTNNENNDNPYKIFLPTQSGCKSLNNIISISRMLESFYRANEPAIIADMLPPRDGDVTPPVCTALNPSLSSSSSDEQFYPPPQQQPDNVRCIPNASEVSSPQSKEVVAAAKDGGGAITTRKLTHSKNKKKFKNKGGGVGLTPSPVIVADGYQMWNDPNKVVAEGTIMYLNTEEEDRDSDNKRAKDANNDESVIGQRPYLVYHNGLFVDPSMATNEEDSDETLDVVNVMLPPPALPPPPPPPHPLHQQTDDEIGDCPTINSDQNSNSLVNPMTSTKPCQLQKKTPDGLPMIIKQAIETTKDDKRKKGKRPNAGIGLNISLANEVAPETPLVEAAPHTIDFAAATTTTTSTSTGHIAEPGAGNPDGWMQVIDTMVDELKIEDRTKSVTAKVDAVVDDDAAFSKAIDALDYDTPTPMDQQDQIVVENRSMDCGEDDDDGLFGSGGGGGDGDEERPEFNSANYWYISPEMPLDLDILANVNNNESDTDESGGVNIVLLPHPPPIALDQNDDYMENAYRDKGKFQWDWYFII